jgi:uncharacterized membrane protein YhaH (DUF805 family)
MRQWQNIFKTGQPASCCSSQVPVQMGNPQQSSFHMTMGPFLVTILSYPAARSLPVQTVTMRLPRSDPSVVTDRAHVDGFSRHHVTPLFSVSNILPAMPMSNRELHENRRSEKPYLMWRCKWSCAPFCTFFVRFGLHSVLQMFTVTFGITDVHSLSLYECACGKNRYSEIPTSKSTWIFACIYYISCAICIPFGVRHVLVKL